MGPSLIEVPSSAYVVNAAGAGSNILASSALTTLPVGVTRHGRDEQNLRWSFVRSKMQLQHILPDPQPLAVSRAAAEQRRRPPRLLRRIGQRQRTNNRGMSIQHCFDLGRVDVESAVDDQIFRAPDDERDFRPPAARGREY